jgi:hypothetical protein
MTSRAALCYLLHTNILSSSPNIYCTLVYFYTKERQIFGDRGRTTFYRNKKLTKRLAAHKAHAR